MSRRKVIWKRSEIEIIIKNHATKTTKELATMLPGRSEKAINRKIEKLRDAGKVQHRTADTVRRAYYQRTKKKKTGGEKGSGSKGRIPIPDDYEPLE